MISGDRPKPFLWRQACNNALQYASAIHQDISAGSAPGRPTCVVSIWHHQALHSARSCSWWSWSLHMLPGSRPVSLAGGKVQWWSDRLAWSYQSGLHPHQSTAIQDCLVAMK